MMAIKSLARARISLFFIAIMKNTPPKKTWTILLLCACLLPMAGAKLDALEYQSLISQNGRTLRAHIHKVVGDQVFLERSDGRKFRAPLNLFSAQSQALIRKLAGGPASVLAEDSIPATPPRATPLPTAPPITPPISPPTTKPLTTGPFGVNPVDAINAPAPTITAGLPPGLPPTTSTFDPPKPVGVLPFAGTAGGGGMVDPTAIMVEGAAILGYLDMAKIRQGPFYELFDGFIDQNEANYQQEVAPVTGVSGSTGQASLTGLKTNDLGVGLEDISSIAVCISSLEGIGSDMLSDPKNIPANTKYAFAVSFSKTIDIELVKKTVEESYQVDEATRKVPSGNGSGEELQELADSIQFPPVFSEFAGASLATVQPGTPDMPPSFCAAVKNQGGTSVLLVGDQSSVKAALTNGQAKAVSGDSRIFANLPSERDFWVTVAIPPKVAQDLAQEAAAGGKDDPQAAMFAGMIQQFEAIGLALSLRNTGKINLFAQCKDAAAATQIASMLNGLVTMAKLANDAPDGPQVPAFINSLAIAPQDNRISVSMEFSPEDLKNLGGGTSAQESPDGEIIRTPTGFQKTTSQIPVEDPINVDAEANSFPPATEPVKAVNPFSPAIQPPRAPTPQPAPASRNPFPPAESPPANTPKATAVDPFDG